MPPTKVIIAGCGIAGPVLAIFLKFKGYEPVVYERLDEPPDHGSSLCLQSNGLRVLSLIPDLVPMISGKQLDKLRFVSVLPEDEGVLAESDIPSELAEKFGHGIMGVPRAPLNRLFIGTAESHGVKIVWGHQLVALQQSEDHVKVTFANGASDTASFVVGCDGLHSNTRTSMFGADKADFTGLTQTGGLSPTPAALAGATAMTNYYGNGAHLICYQVSDTHTSWAITLQEPEEKESWRAMSEERQKAFREGPFSKWSYGAGELVATAADITMRGLYDRQQLKTWHKGRVVLLGDAAHPTSPHLGQGANQAFEDIYHFVRLLVQHNPSAESPSMDVLSTIFSELEQLRIVRTSELVKKARKGGESRVQHGVAACDARNNAVRDMGKNEEVMRVGFTDLFSQPFMPGQSQI